MPKRKTDEQFKKEVFDLVGEEYTFLDTYINAMTKLRVKHNKCSNIYKVTPSAFLRGNRCPSCFGTPKKTDAQFKKEVHDLVGDEYTFLDSYVNTTTKLRVRHNKCGNTFKVMPSNFIRGSRCPYCSGKMKKTDFKFKQEVKNLVGNEYTFLDTYVNNKTKLRVKHNSCGHTYKVKPNVFLRGYRCPYCSINAQKTDNQFKQEVYDLVGDEYKFLDTYRDAHIKMRIKHNKCGNIYEVAPHHFLEGHRCPYCNSPKGEIIITRILRVLGIRYESQKTFDDLKDAQPLSYDFYIPDQNILIEYQGLQHYQPVDYFGGDNAFNKQQIHDKLKSDYAKNNGYNLIAVPYTEDNFSKIKKYLVKHGLRQ